MDLLRNLDNNVMEVKGLQQGNSRAYTLDLLHRERVRDGTPERMRWLRERVADLLNEPIGEHGNGPGRGKRVDNINSFLSTKGGTSPAYTIRRLKRDAPELAERVIRGA